jgi:hypothetical protein
MMIGATLNRTFTAVQQEEGKGFGLGDHYRDQSGNEYVYVQYGAGGATANFVVTIKADYSAVMATNALALLGEQVGVAMATGAASTFGWVMVYGVTNVQTDVATANTRMQTTTVAGQIDDASGVGTKQINGLALSAARTVSAGLAPALLTYPTVGATN